MNGLRAVTLSMLAALTAGCASTVEAISSPSYRPEETDLLYKYGEFCGPGVPDLPAASTASALTSDGQMSVRLRTLLSMQPVDDIDAACRAHDICYELFGHDNDGCDKMMAELAELSPLGEESTSDTSDPSYTLEQQCILQSFEVGNTVAYYKRRKSDREAQTMQTVLLPMVGILAGVDATVRMSGVALWGYPDAPGQCFYQPGMRNAALNDSLLYLGDAIYRKNCSVETCTFGESSVESAQQIARTLSTSDVDWLLNGGADGLATLSPAIRRAAAGEVSDFGPAPSAVLDAVRALFAVNAGAFVQRQQIGALEGSTGRDRTNTVVVTLESPDRIVTATGRKRDANYLQDGQYYVANVGRNKDTIHGVYDIVDAGFDPETGAGHFILAGVQRLGGFTKQEVRFMTWRDGEIWHSIGAYRMRNSNDPFTVFLVETDVPQAVATQFPPSALSSGFAVGQKVSDLSPP